MKRRQFIQIAATGVATAILPTAASSKAGPPTIHALASSRLLELLGSSDAVRDIGLAYRERYPSERSIDALARHILTGSPYSSHRSRTEIRRRLDEQIRDDFDRGRTVRLNGWMLSRTEGRQAALYSLLS